MLKLNGTHGTSVSRAEEIEASGFTRETSIGRAGRGIYFWAYLDHDALAVKLAHLWWQNSSNRGAYLHCAEKGCAVLFGEISVPKDGYLDFNDEVVEDSLNVAVDHFRKDCDPNEPISDEMIHKVYEYVITSLEEVCGHSIDVIRARVAPPRGKFIEKIIVGNPNCYVARARFDRIKVVKIERV